MTSRTSSNSLGSRISLHLCSRSGYSFQVNQDIISSHSGLLISQPVEQSVACGFKSQYSVEILRNGIHWASSSLINIHLIGMKEAAFGEFADNLFSENSVNCLSVC